MNSVFDDTDNYLSSELKAIIDHRSSNGDLEFKVENTSGDKQRHPIELINDEDPHDTANYIITNVFGIIKHITHSRWARLFLRSLKRILYCLRHSDFLGFEAKICNPSPTSKKRRSRRYAKKMEFLQTCHTRHLIPNGRVHSSLTLELPRLGRIY